MDNRKNAVTLASEMTAGGQYNKDLKGIVSSLNWTTEQFNGAALFLEAKGAVKLVNPLARGELECVAFNTDYDKLENFIEEYGYNDDYS